ncbi:hypothetical protein [Helicobacter ailurogastricus]|uniref:hypothetical protein n=1 Tax=Helicobacter ailurogastricus TaxID=1578720 RepID=UPI0013154DE7|nr:hypothetical protein [Helicobacter ailurogastricus]
MYLGAVGILQKEDYKRLEKDLEKHFDVKMDLGSVIQGKNSKSATPHGITRV